MLITPKLFTDLLRQNQIEDGTKILVAVSGGADSLALLDLLVRVRTSCQLQLVAVHINHQLRSESVQEEACVRHFCAERQVELIVRHWEQDTQPVSGIEAAARAFRYTVFTEVAKRFACTVIMTAHHRDDQTETVLFRLLRSGDVESARGILNTRDFEGVQLVRPLLSVSKADLRKYADAAKLPYSDDPSNADVHYQRNYLRHRVLPMLREVDAQADEHLRHFAEEQAGMVELANVTVQHLLKLLGPKTDEFDWTPVHTEKHVVQQIVLTAALKRIYAAITAKQVRMVLQALMQNDGRTRYVRLAANYQLWVKKLRVGLVSTEADSKIRVPCVLTVDRRSSSEVFKNFVLTTTVQPDDFVLTNLPVPAVTLRSREPADRLLMANGHHQLLRRWFINMHIPQNQRNAIVVAASDNDVYWLGTIDGNQLWQAPQTDKIKASLVLRRS